MSYTMPSQPYLRTGHPLNRGLVGGWPMSEGGGPDTRDISGRGNHGTLAGGAAWVMSEMGPAMRFTLVGSKTVALKNPVSLQRSFTLGAWCRRTEDELQNDYNGFRSTSTTFNNETLYFGFSSYAGTPRAIVYLLDGDGVSKSLMSPTGMIEQPSLGVWSHIATTFDAESTALSLYYNGRLAAGPYVTGVTVAKLPAALWGIGHYYRDGVIYGTTVYGFGGDIGSTTFHSRVLAPAEIQRLAGLDGDPFKQWRPEKRRRDDDFYGPPINNDIGDSAFLGSVV